MTTVNHVTKKRSRPTDKEIGEMVEKVVCGIVRDRAFDGNDSCEAGVLLVEYIGNIVMMKLEELGIVEVTNGHVVELEELN